MIETLYEWLFNIALIYLALIVAAYIFRSVMGPSFFDRILSVNNISTITIIMICILSVVQGESYIVDVAFIYALLGFVTIVIVCKAYLRSHKKERTDDFSNLEEGEHGND